MQDNILDDHLFENSPEEEFGGKFETYRMFTHESIAMDFVTLLDENNIPYKLEKGQDLLDGSIIGNSIRPHIALKLIAADFPKVNDLLEKDIENKNGEYYEVLDDFSKEELFDILNNPDEWSAEAVATAKVRLQQQGEVIDENYMNHLRESRLKEIRQGKKPHEFWPIFYSILGIVGGFLLLFYALIPALGMGWYYWKSKNVDFEGKKYYTFVESTRNYGVFIFVAAIASFIIGLVWWTYVM